MPQATDTPTRKELANALRVLAMDAIQKAKSGHPGAPMGMADMAEALWNDFLIHNPANPKWVNRDRFVLSNGHASMLLYGLLHLSGYALSMDDIKSFRQLNSKTPGHPEYGVTPGVETTTGPLGQGIATAVGMALAEKLLAEEYNREGLNIIDHFTYVFLGDGCLMEGISHEACSFAGTLGLGKLIALWDNNGISIDGDVKGWFAEDTLKRFEAYGWQVDEVDGQDGEAVKKAIAKARKVTDRPSFISCRTTIALGAPTKAGSAASHGSPLGDEEIAAARKLLNWNAPPFEIPAEIRQGWDARLRGLQAESKWDKLFEKYRKSYPLEAEVLEKRLQGDLPSSWTDDMLTLAAETLKQKDLQEATRVSSQKVLDVLGPKLRDLVGGSADLTGSVGTWHKGSVAISRDNFKGNYIRYGVREFAMGAIMNGLALHGGFIPYGGTFLIFSDYAKNAIRLSALMEQRLVWVLTHDSIGVGEDGPTHQPVEQLGMLRLTPGLNVWRPADRLECCAAWSDALIRRHTPTCLSLSRQNLPLQDYSNAVLYDNPSQESEISHAEQLMQTMRRGGYILREAKGGDPEGIFIATGSEVQLAIEAARQMEASGRRIRVVSMPCADLFDAQEVPWRCNVLPLTVRARVAVEASAADWWRKYVGLDGSVVGMTSFGLSAPGSTLFKRFGFTVENLVLTMEKLLA